MKLEHVLFLIELATAKGVNVPIPHARLAADTLDALKALAHDLKDAQAKNPREP